MSILIKGKQLPESCWKCWEWRNVGTGIYCALLCKNLRIGNGHPGKERKEWCPLAEIPPHGRLVDADKPIALTDSRVRKIEVTVAHIIENNGGTVDVIIPAEEEKE